MNRSIHRKLLPVLLVMATMLALLMVGTLQANAESSAVSEAGEKAELIFVDTNISDYVDLARHFSQRGEIVYIDKGLGQIADILAERTGIDAVHILSHGSAGRLYICNEEISSDSVGEYEKEWKKIGHALNANGDILIYACNLANDEKGKSMVQYLSRVTGADVASSSDMTGSRSFDADWDLEYCTGYMDIEPLVISGKSSWEGTLLVPGTQELKSGWETDPGNGFFAPAGSVDSTKIKYEADSIWLDAASTSNEWIEFTADPDEGLEAFDLTSVTLGKYSDSSISFAFTIAGTKKSDGTLVTKSFSWPSGSELTKAFSGTDFSEFTGITKFRITLQDVSTSIYKIEFRGFTIDNQISSSNSSPVISGLNDAAYLENDVNQSFLQIDNEISVADNESVDFDGGQIIVSYSGTALPEDQLSVVNTGNVSLSVNTVNYNGVGQIGTASGGANGASLTILLNSNATPARTSELLEAIAYKNTSDEPTSYRTISITVSDGDGGTSMPATARISVSGQGESGVEYPSNTQDLNTGWIDDLNNGFMIHGNGGVTLGSDGTSIWLNSGTGTASFSIAAGEQFEGGMFDLSGLVFDVLGSGKMYTITITGYKPDASTVTADVTGDTKEGLGGIDLSSITGIVSFDLQITGLSSTVDNVGLDSFTIANPQSAGTINTVPVISDLNDAAYLENDVNQSFLQIDNEISVADNESADFDGGQLIVSYSGTPLPEDQLSVGNIGNISLSGNAVNYNGVGQIGTASGGANGESLTISLNSNATPARTSELLEAIAYKNTSDEPASYRTISVTVSDGDGGTSLAATARISVSGQGESGTEYPSDTQDLNTGWIDDLNNGFTIHGNGGVTLGSDGTSIWLNSGTGTASFSIAAGEQFEGGMFDLSGLTFDVLGSGKMYTITITGYKPDASTVTADVTGDTKEGLGGIDLSSITGIVSFDLRITSSSAAVSNVGLDSFTIANPGTANSAPGVSGLPADISVNEDHQGNADLSAVVFSDADGDVLTVTLTASTGTFTANSGGDVTIGGSGTRILSLSGNAADINAFLDTSSSITYTGALNLNGISADVISVSASDGKANSMPGTINVNISAINDDPTIAGLPSDVTAAEGAAINVDLSASSFSDVDSGAGSVTLTLTASNGTLTASSGGGVTVTGSGTASLNLIGSVISIDNYLNNASNIQYLGSAGVFGNDADSITLTANDGGNTGTGGGTDVTLGTVYIDIAETPPAVSSVNSTSANGVYGIGDVINITVAFTKPITVSGTPQLTMETGAVDRVAYYTRDSSTSVLTFAYTVESGDTSADLDYLSTSGLSLNGGTIRSSSGTDAILTLPAPGAAGSLGGSKAIVIDTTAPATPFITGLAAGSDTGVSNADSITNAVKPTFAGTAEANSTVGISSSVDGYLGTTTADGSGNWSFTAASALAQGVHSIVAAAVDGAGNTSPDSAGLIITIDTTAPTATVSLGSTNLIAGDITLVTFTFTEAVDGFDNTDVTVYNGVLAPVSSADGGVTYTAEFTADSIDDNTNTIVVDLTGIGDIAGNAGSGNAASDNYSVSVTATIAVSLQSAIADGAADSATSTRINLVFDTAVAGLTAEDIIITNGTGTAVKGALTGSGTSWSIALTSVTAQGNVIVTVSSPSGYNISGSPKTTAVYKKAVIINAVISPAAGSFDKNNASQVDVQTSVISWGSATGITDVKSGGISIGAGNYSVSGNSLTIRKEYLASQTIGNLVLTVEFNAGAAAALTINVTDTTPPVINPASVNYDLNAPADVITLISWNSAATVTDVVYGSTPLSGITDYIVAGNTLTISESYLTGLMLTEGDTLDFDITFNTGASVYLTVYVVNNYVPSNNADLSSLSVNGIPVSGFDPDDTEYDVELPYGASVATVTAATSDSNAVYDLTPASSLPGSATVLVTAEDNTTTRLYTINFTIAAPPAFVPVKDITGVPATATAGHNLTLIGTVSPANATNQAIVWSVLDAGTTGANVSENILSAAAAGTVTVRATIANGMAAGTDYTQDFTITVSTAPVTTYTITASAGSGGSITPSGAVSVAVGSDQTFSILPGSGYRISYVMVDGISQGAISTYTFRSITVNHTINAAFARISTGDERKESDESTPQDKESSTQITPIYNADINKSNDSDSILPVAVDKNSGSARVETGLGNNLMSEGKTTVITVPAISNVDTYMLVIPVPSISADSEQGTLEFRTDEGSVTIPSDMLTGVDKINGSKAGISISRGDKDSLPDNIIAAIGNRPLVQITFSIDDKQTEWNNPDAPVKVSIPYTPTAEELANPESIVIWYIDGSGNAISVPNGQYDPVNGTVTFTTTHFSYYAVGYNKAGFIDVPADAWYYSPISFIAARDITRGVGNGRYSPQERLTRGEFIVMLMKAYGINPEANMTNNFADAGNTYYTGYLAAAKRLGISDGIGNNRYAPDKPITRQELCTLLYNALEAAGRLPADTSGKQLSSFEDSEEVAPWAKDAMKLFTGAGILNGNAGKLDPAGTATRAELAQVLYNLLRE